LIPSLSPSSDKKTFSGVVIGKENGTSFDAGKWIWWIGFAVTFCVVAFFQIYLHYRKKNSAIKLNKSLHTDLDEVDDYDIDKTDAGWTGITHKKFEASSTMTMTSGEITKKSEKVNEDSTLGTDEEDLEQTEIGMIVSYEEDTMQYEHNISQLKIESNEENTTQRVIQSETKPDKERVVKMDTESSNNAIGKYARKTDTENTKKYTFFSRNKSANWCCDCEG